MDTVLYRKAWNRSLLVSAWPVTSPVALMPCPKLLITAPGSGPRPTADVPLETNAWFATADIVELPVIKPAALIL
jgi:hypothetical protein